MNRSITRGQSQVMAAGSTMGPAGSRKSDRGSMRVDRSSTVRSSTARVERGSTMGGANSRADRGSQVSMFGTVTHVSSVSSNAGVLEDVDDEEELDWLNPQELMRQLWLRFCSRLARLRDSASEAVANEVHEGWGKTATAKTISHARQTGPKELRREFRRKVFKALTFVSNLGTDNLAKKGKARKKQVEEVVAEDKEHFGVHTFVIHNPGAIESYFKLHEEIKTGGSSKIYRGVESATGVSRAVKKILKVGGAGYLKLMQEVAIMKTLDHPNICRLFETFEDDRHLYLVLELCEGGDVLDRLLDRNLTPNGLFSEFQAAVIVRMVLMTVNYLHANGFVHRDIKPENVLFKDKHHDVATSKLRLTDFGFSCKLQPGVQMTTKVGSPCYIAPEVLEGKYDQRCDLWSAGVLCYLLLCGYPPFAGQTESETLHLVREGKFTFHRQSWEGVSKPAKHLIRHLIEKDTAKRIPLEKALEHPWIKARGVISIAFMREETVDRLITYHTCHRLRRAAMLAVAFQLEAQDTRGLLELFQALDMEGDGLLTGDEFAEALKSICGVEEEFIGDMMKSLDTDRSGLINYTEFLAATLEKDVYIKKHPALMRAFRCFDKDDSGGLSKDELMEALCMSGPDAEDEIDEIFEEVDTNGDGVMDYGEFYRMLQKEPESRGIFYKEDGTLGLPEQHKLHHRRAVVSEAESKLMAAVAEGSLSAAEAQAMLAALHRAEKAARQEAATAAATLRKQRSSASSSSGAGSDGTSSASGSGPNW